MFVGQRILDWRGREDHDILDEARNLLLTKRDDVASVKALVDSEKFARKIIVWASVVRCSATMEKVETHWEVTLHPSGCGPSVIFNP